MTQSDAPRDRNPLQRINARIIWEGGNVPADDAPAPLSPAALHAEIDRYMLALDAGDLDTIEEILQFVYAANDRVLDQLLDEVNTELNRIYGLEPSQEERERARRNVHAILARQAAGLPLRDALGAVILDPPEGA